MSILEVSNLTKTFPAKGKNGQAFTAVKNISFELNKGEVLGLLGPNGAGKTTTMSMLLGIMSPTSGTIKYFGKDFAQHRSEVLQDVTFASTYIRMPWRLSIWENLQVFALLYGLDQATFEKRATHFLKFFGVWKQRYKSINDVSAGQLTRIMLTKAFIPHPKVVLLDEPTASLDPDIAHQVRQFVLEQQQQFDTSILYTSHNMDEVTEVCDRVLFLKQGQIVANDTPENLAASVSIAHMRLQVKDGLKRTQQVAKQLGLDATIDNREIEIKLDEHQIAQVLSQLASQGIEYTQISITKPTLEDYFLTIANESEWKTNGYESNS